MATIKALRNIDSTGLRLHKDETKDLPVFSCLLRTGDPNLEISYSESDREELMQLDTDKFEFLSGVFDRNISTHDELCALLLPSKPKTKKLMSKPKKSSLEE